MAEQGLIVEELAQRIEALEAKQREHDARLAELERKVAVDLQIAEILLNAGKEIT